jgi:hypothetical protein
MHSDNAHAFGAATRVFDTSDFASGDLFVEVTPAVRLGVNFSWIDQTYVDKTDAKDYRTQLSGYLIF